MPIHRFEHIAQTRIVSYSRGGVARRRRSDGIGLVQPLFVLRMRTWTSRTCEIIASFGPTVPSSASASAERSCNRATTRRARLPCCSEDRRSGRPAPVRSAGPRAEAVRAPRRTPSGPRSAPSRWCRSPRRSACQQDPRPSSGGSPPMPSIIAWARARSPAARKPSASANRTLVSRAPALPIARRAKGSASAARRNFRRSRACSSFRSGPSKLLGWIWSMLDNARAWSPAQPRPTQSGAVRGS